MNEKLSLLLIIAESSGLLAPLLFILLHVLRQFLLIPPAVLCIAGGILFGTVFGTAYSFIGLFISSLLFYSMFEKMPGVTQKLSKLKARLFGEYRYLTVPQVAVLRLIPFIHYHLLSYCLLERNKGLKAYTKGSLASNLPLAFFYTVFGQFITSFTPTLILILLFSLTMLTYLLREKMTTIKWRDFFHAT